MLEIVGYIIYFGSLLLMPILGCIFDDFDEEW